MTRPRGRPPTPSAASIDKQPVGMVLTGTSTARLPRRMIEPLPYDFSICDIAASSNFAFSSDISHLGRGKYETFVSCGTGTGLHGRDLRAVTSRGVYHSFLLGVLLYLSPRPCPANPAATNDRNKQD